MTFEELKLKYVGKELHVEVVESPYMDRDGKNYSFKNYECNDQLLLEFANDAKQSGYVTRVVLPEHPITMEYCTDRINVQVENRDDKFIIAGFNIG